MKKALSCILALAMMLSLAACGGSASSGGAAADTTPAADTADEAEAPADSGDAAEAEPAAWKPEKPVDFIVPFNAGGSSDLLARIFANQGAKYFDNDFVILNEGGGSCSIGLSDLIGRKPDGYAIGICNNGIPILPLTIETPFNYPEEVTALCMWGIAPYVLVVNANSPYQTLEDLMTAIKENPNGLVSGACAVASNTHIEMEWLAYTVDSDVKSVVYDGGSACVAALLGNNIDMTVQTPADVQQYIESGDLRCLAIFSDRRMTSELFADVPTAQEVGYDLISECYQGCGGPKDMPEEIVKYYEDCFSAALQDPEVIEAINGLGFEVIYEDSKTYRERWGHTVEQFSEILETLGDRLQIA